MKPLTALIISYHFYPAREIGARRVTELARYLVEKGVRVVVVSAFGNQPIQPGSELFPTVIAVPIKRPQRPWLDLLVALKRRVLADTSNAQDLGSVSADPVLGHHGGTPPLRARLHQGFFRLVYFVDDYKKWAWQAARAAVRAGREYEATLVLASGPPHSGLLAGAWAARSLGIPYVADLRDPWSDLITTG
jgi:hypothetical protein